MAPRPTAAAAEDSAATSESDGGGGFHALPESGDSRGVGLTPGGAAPGPQSATGGKVAAGAQSSSSSSTLPPIDSSFKDEETGGGGSAYAPLESETSPPPPPLRSPRNDDLFFSWMSDAKRKLIIQVSYLSVFAVLGTLLRIVLAQIFGEECKNPGSVGWLAAAEPLCVTADGQAEFEGSGIVFADLPANLLGSFIMGFFLAGGALGLPTERLSVAWLRPDSPFQSWDVLHLAIRTGFCGSLTTFSSWNSEMVVMIYGTGQMNARSQLLRAVFGYVIGMETALGSFVFGKNMATWIFRRVNPELAREGEATDAARERGVWIDRTLPDFERRYLPDLDVERVSYYDADAVVHLERWRASTANSRRVGDKNLGTLKEIEAEALVRGNASVPLELRSAGEKAGWNVNELEAWVDAKRRTESATGASAALDGEETHPQTRREPAHVSLNVAVPLFITVFTGLALGVVFHDGYDAPSITYRTMWYASLWAPLGALLRWHLSKYNGKLPGYWSWFPAGTLAANLLGSIVSISMISAELKLSGVEGFWVMGTLRAVKVGFSGCLTTVSTFVSEVTVHMKKPHQYRGYKYILISLGLCCLFGVAIYGWIVYVI